MKKSKFWHLFIRDKESGTFASFFLHASNKEKMRIYKEAASRANEEQQAVFLKSNLEISK